MEVTSTALIEKNINFSTDCDYAWISFTDSADKEYK